MEFTDRQIEIIEASTRRIDQFGIQEFTMKSLAADINLSEAALYRHYKSKHEILLGLLSYFIHDMNFRISQILENEDEGPSHIIRQIFNSQLNTFVEKPAIISVIFSEGIFQFNKELTQKVVIMMEIIQKNISSIVNKGQLSGKYSTLLSAEVITTIIMGSMRMVVLKWKLTKNKSNVVSDGLSVLNGILKMIEK